MGVIDTEPNSTEVVSKGFSEVRGSKEYIICKHGNRILCFFYAGDAGKTLIDHYLNNNHIKKVTTKLEIKSLRNNSVELAEMLHKKIVILDKKVVAYEDVIELSKLTKIKGYTEGTLKNNFNVFSTL